MIRRRELGEMPLGGVSAASAPEENSDMSETLVERVWAWLHETFPERQIYIRSDGRVQFFSFSPTLQATIAGLCLIFFTWVAFATVNVVFKDRIIAAKDHRYQEMQSTYENRLADLQSSYDELNGALVSAEDRFKVTADELQTKQNTIMKFVNRKQQLDATLQSFASSTAAAASNRSDKQPRVAAPLSATTGSTDADTASASAVSAAPEVSAPEFKPAHVPASRPTQASLLDLGAAADRLSRLLLGARQRALGSVEPADTLVRHPTLQTLVVQTDRVRGIGVAETEMLSGTERRLSERVASLQGIIRRTGIDPQQYERKFGVGGPDLPIQSVHIDGIADATFEKAYMSASAILEQMDSLLSALRHIPLATPISGPDVEHTSGFGPRVDPFTGNYSFHPGVDFGGPYGSIVSATAPGAVIWAGARGGYGNMVEIDHGFGIHTRYAHLASISVRTGTRVSQGSPLGRLGSTGRSTGPHVHYEIWYDDIVRNPDKFVEAGHHVLQ